MYAKGTLKYYLFVSCLPLGRGRFVRHSTVLDTNIMVFLTESHDNIHLPGNLPGNSFYKQNSQFVN